MADDVQDVPSFGAYQDAIEKYGKHPIRFEIPLLHLTMLLSALQLSLQHPTFPDAVRPWVEGFVTEAIANLERLNPVFGQVFRAGSDRAQDREI